MKLIKESKIFDGMTRFYSHDSQYTKTLMNFSTFEPAQVSEIERGIIFLSGLTCDENNFITKAGSQKFLSHTKTMIVCPDTSPRGLSLLREHDSYDFGSGASFYINATTEGYKDHYRMEDYLIKELIPLVQMNFPSMKEVSIMGHSMGGHGALTLGLKYPFIFKSVSAFAPICHPKVFPWGKKAFEGYLGLEKDLWDQNDATMLLLQGKKREDTILIHQGLRDEYLETELGTSQFENAAKEVGQNLDLRYCHGYDHGYFFISTFIEEHIKFHQSH